ncbi:hypothetical protein [Natrinema gari]|uniref:RiboL-PSP-HEPN domain-containing protein n=1 Tax=Natrinema gari JCM 14663 TaxID=1230459 RepID=L9YU34_9EURY|nr:hypothetical protein [Natrinema gari]ELY77196.1 hypothetical protein C486_17165 [Natrinema gari JCM 14663]
MPLDDGDNSEKTSSSIVDKAESAATQALTEVDLEVNLSEDTLISMYEAAEAVEDSRKTIRDSIDWRSLYNAVESYLEEVAEVIVNDIDGLESPEDYDPSEITVTPIAEQFAKNSTDSLIDELESGGYSDLNVYLDRLKAGRQHTRDADYGAATFYFISVQDGLMSMLCDYFGFSTNSDGYYERSDKVKAFAKAYDNAGYDGIETGDIIPPYQDFYDHRNAIVHGSPTSAHLDRDIALLSMLFLMLTLDAAVSEMA